MKITNRFTAGKALLLSAALLALGAGCGSGSGEVHGPNGGNGPKINAEAKKNYDDALEQMRQLDKSNGWNEENCAQVATKFAEASDKNDTFVAAAVYNAGVAYQRCNNRAKASEYYKKVLEKDPKFHRARVPLALFAFADSNETAVDPAISELGVAVHDSDFQNTEALVNLARLQMKRDNSTKDDDGPNDFERAKKNLQRSLAVDDAYMPAFNQLAIYYLQTAKKQAGQKSDKFARGGAKSQKVDTQALDLAQLVTSQAIHKNPGFAPVYNTAGLIAVQQADLNRAVQAFSTARKLDPSFFEADMNYASVNMQFRGFGQAEEAYRAALKVRPNDYDAHLGLALALRGQIDDVNMDQKLREADAEIEAAKKIDDTRPEAYFNQGILTQEYKAKSGDAAANTALDTAQTLFQGFVQRAQGKAEFADAVDDVNAVASKPDQQCLGPKAKEDHACKKGRIQNLKEIIQFNKETAAEQKKMAESQKQNAALDDAGTAPPGDAAAPEAPKQ